MCIFLMCEALNGNTCMMSCQQFEKIEVYLAGTDISKGSWRTVPGERGK